MRFILVEKLKEVMIFLFFFSFEKTVLKAFLKLCLFIWDTLTKSDRLFSLDCEFQHRQEQGSMLKVALPRVFSEVVDMFPLSHKFPISSFQEGCAGLDPGL